jgi:metal-responsive CopG/Arc/MetJ family transcriptional regulator
MKPVRKSSNVRLRLNDVSIPIRMPKHLVIALDREAHSQGISRSDLIRRRVQGRQVPESTDKLERLCCLTLNVLQRLGRDIQQGATITLDHVHALMLLEKLASHFSRRGAEETKETKS